MEYGGPEDECVEEVFLSIDEDGNLTAMERDMIVYDEVELEEHTYGNDENEEPKPKRRGNLTMFNESQSTKRKNESAKRELTSIVKQLDKIDKQLNTNGDDTRVSINFVATFNSFKSNRISTFKYPSEAEIKPTFLNYDSTISAVKIAVKEAMDGFIPRKEVEAALTSASDVQTTPLKTMSAIISVPSPVNLKKALPTLSKNLCAKNSCTFGKKLRKPVWVKCGFDGSCNFWVHAPCIGFPNLKEGDVPSLKGWFCPDHTKTQMKRK